MQNIVKVNERDKLVLTCKVLGVKGQLSVTWQHKATSAAIFTNVISLSQEGVMETGGEFSRRRVKATRPTTDTFTLELDEVTPSDSGVYQCAVSEWKTNSKTNSQSQTATVTVEPVGKSSVCVCSRSGWWDGWWKLHVDTKASSYYTDGSMTTKISQCLRRQNIWHFWQNSGKTKDVSVGQSVRLHHNSLVQRKIHLENWLAGSSRHLSCVFMVLRR